MHKQIKIILSAILFCTGTARAQTITTIAGIGKDSIAGDNGPAIKAQLSQPIALTVDRQGNIYVIDAGADVVRRITKKGIITTFAGTGKAANKTTLGKPHGIAADNAGNIYITEYSNYVIRKSTSTGITGIFAGAPQQPASFGYGAAGTKASATLLNTPNGIAADSAGNIYFADQWNYTVLKITTDNTLIVIAGNGYGGYSGNNGPATAATLGAPWGVAADNKGNVYFTDIRNNTVHKISTEGIITTIAGKGIRGYGGDGGPATDATLNEPYGIAADHNGNIYIADAGNNIIRRIDADNIITTFAGTGNRGYTGDGGPASAAQLSMPRDVAIDKAGNIYIADMQNHVVRRISAPPKNKKAAKPIATVIKDAYSIAADPDRNELIITTDSGAYTSFIITDAADKVMLTQPAAITKTRIDLGALPPARYYLHLKNSKKERTALFIKN